jgi:hypothetical protein
MAQIAVRPQRFTSDEWKLANKIKHKTAERNRSIAERLILDSDRLDGETREQSDTTLADVDKKIGKIHSFQQQNCFTFNSIQFNFFFR